MSLMARIRGMFSAKARTEQVYKTGLEKANQKDFEGAILDYSKVIYTWEAPAELKAKAQLNRALAYSALKNNEKSIEDLNALLKLEDCPASVRSAAREKLERIKKWSG